MTMRKMKELLAPAYKIRHACEMRRHDQRDTDRKEWLDNGRQAFKAWPFGVGDRVWC